MSGAKSWVEAVVTEDALCEDMNLEDISPVQFLPSDAMLLP